MRRYRALTLAPESVVRSQEHREEFEAEVTALLNQNAAEGWRFHSLQSLGLDQANPAAALVVVVFEADERRDPTPGRLQEGIFRRSTDR
jgi:hypothetical protein